MVEPRGSDVCGTRPACGPFVSQIPRLLDDLPDRRMSCSAAPWSRRRVLWTGNEGDDFEKHGRRIALPEWRALSDELLMHRRPRAA